MSEPETIVTVLDASLAPIQDMLHEARILMPVEPDRAIALIDAAQTRLEQCEQAQVVQDHIVKAQMRIIEKLREQRNGLLCELEDKDYAIDQAYQDGYRDGERAAGMDVIPDLAELADMANWPPEPTRGTPDWAAWHNGLDESQLNCWFLSLSVTEQAEYQRWAAQ